MWISDTEADESDGWLRFGVWLNQAHDEYVCYDFETLTTGTAVEEVDYALRPKSTLWLSPGQVADRPFVRILDDSMDDPGETVKVKISNARLCDNPSATIRITRSEATGTITNDDPLQRAWLGRFGRSVGTHVTDAVGDRLRRTPASASHVTIGGYRLPLGRQGGGEATPGQGDQASRSPGERAPAPDATTGPGEGAGARHRPDRGDQASLSPGGRGEGEGAQPGASAETDQAPGVSAVLAEVARVLGMGPGAATPTEAPWRNEPGPDPRLGQGQTLDLGQRFTLRQVLLGSSFRLALNKAAPGAAVPPLTAWGRFAGTAFDGQDGDLSLDGDVFTGTVGLDGEWDRVLAGVAVAHSRGTGGYATTGLAAHGQGELESTLTSLHPYLRYAVTDRLDVWGLVGYGWGDLELAMETGETVDTDTDFLMGAFGGRGLLLAAAETGGVQLATRTEAMFTRTSSDAAATSTGGAFGASEADAHRVRVILEGSRGVTWAHGRTFTPTVELGVRHDWGDAETGFGLELGGRVRYADPTLGLTVEGTVRGLLAHEDAHYQEWGASGTVRLAPGQQGQGLAVSLSPTWGAVQSGVDGLWSRQTTQGLAPAAQRAQNGQLAADVGYGFPAFDMGLLTPYAGTVLAAGQTRTYRVGARWAGVSGLTLNLEGARQEPAGPQPVNQGLQLQAAWGF